MAVGPVLERQRSEVTSMSPGLEELVDSVVRTVLESPEPKEPRPITRSCIRDSHLFPVRPLPLTVISYDAFMKRDEETLGHIRKALKEEGVFGISDIPGYVEATEEYLKVVRAFHALPSDIKERYSPDGKTQSQAGYEFGKERFRRDDGSWVIDHAKTSYYFYAEYGTLPEREFPQKWPLEINLEGPTIRLGRMIAHMTQGVLQKIDALLPTSGVDLSLVHGVGRSLYYRSNPENQNPLWCGDHFDHGLLTGLMPSAYYWEGERIQEPEEAGLFVQKADGAWYKVKAQANVMLFQVGEFAQLATDGRMQATKHCVHRADDPRVERFTMAVFVSPDMKSTVTSQDELAKDARYTHFADGKERTDGRCTFRDFHFNSLQRYKASS